MPPTTPPTIFLDDDERPDLPESPLSPLSAGAPDDEVADCAAMTLLVVVAMLIVLLPLTDTTVVTTCWVTLPVRCVEVLEPDDVRSGATDSVRVVESADEVDSD